MQGLEDHYFRFTSGELFKSSAFYDSPGIQNIISVAFSGFIGKAEAIFLDLPHEKSFPGKLG